MTYDDTDERRPVGRSKAHHPHLVENLQRQIEEQGLNAKELSKLAGLGLTAVHDILAARSVNPSLRTIEALAGALRTDVTSLTQKSSNQETSLGGSSPRRLSVTDIPVVGMAESRTMRPDIVGSDAPLRTVAGPSHRDYPAATCMALQVMDRSMEAGKPVALPEGSYALGVDLVANNLLVESDKMYAVKRCQCPNVNGGGGSAELYCETIIRRAKVYHDRVELIAQTHERVGKYEPIVVSGRLTSDPRESVYAFALIYGAVSLSY